MFHWAFSLYIFLTIVMSNWIKYEGFVQKVEKLLEPRVWLDAATQVFYSFGLAFGSLIAFGSYNTPDNNCVRDVILVSCCNVFTALYASAVVFAILGFKAMSNVDKCLARWDINMIWIAFLRNHWTEWENSIRVRSKAIFPKITSKYSHAQEIIWEQRRLW